MFEELLKIFKRKKRNCLTVVRDNCAVLEGHVVIKRKKQNVIVSEQKTELSKYFENLTGLNYRERSKFNSF